jgi:hypothetical protein
MRFSSVSMNVKKDHPGYRMVLVLLLGFFTGNGGVFV